MNATTKHTPGPWTAEEDTSQNPGQLVWNVVCDQPGYVHARTKRVAVSAGDFAKSTLNGDVSAYWFNENADKMNLDPWTLVEGVDPHLDGERLDVWFANGCMKTVGYSAILFLSAKDAEMLGVEQRSTWNQPTSHTQSRCG